MSTPEKGKPRLMTTGEVAKYLRLSRSSIYRMVKDKEIPVSKLGQQLRFRKDIIDNWLTQKEEEHRQKP